MKAVLTSEHLVLNLDSQSIPHTDQVHTVKYLPCVNNRLFVFLIIAGTAEEKLFLELWQIPADAIKRFCCLWVSLFVSKTKILMLLYYFCRFVSKKKEGNRPKNCINMFSSSLNV